MEQALHLRRGRPDGVGLGGLSVHRHVGLDRTGPHGLTTWGCDRSGGSHLLDFFADSLSFDRLCVVNPHRRTFQCLQKRLSLFQNKVVFLQEQSDIPQSHQTKCLSGPDRKRVLTLRLFPIPHDLPQVAAQIINSGPLLKNNLSLPGRHSEGPCPVPASVLFYQAAQIKHFPLYLLPQI